MSTYFAELADANSQLLQSRQLWARPLPLRFSAPLMKTFKARRLARLSEQLDQIAAIVLHCQASIPVMQHPAILHAATSRDFPQIDLALQSWACGVEEERIELPRVQLLDWEFQNHSLLLDALLRQADGDGEIPTELLAWARSDDRSKAMRIIFARLPDVLVSYRRFVKALDVVDCDMNAAAALDGWKVSAAIVPGGLQSPAQQEFRHNPTTLAMLRALDLQNVFISEQALSRELKAMKTNDKRIAASLRSVIIYLKQLTEWTPPLVERGPGGRLVRISNAGKKNLGITARY